MLKTIPPKGEGLKPGNWKLKENSRGKMIEKIVSKHCFNPTKVFNGMSPRSRLICGLGIGAVTVLGILYLRSRSDLSDRVKKEPESKEGEIEGKKEVVEEAETLEEQGKNEGLEGEIEKKVEQKKPQTQKKNVKQEIRKRSASVDHSSLNRKQKKTKEDVDYLDLETKTKIKSMGTGENKEELGLKEAKPEETDYETAESGWEDEDFFDCNEPIEEEVEEYDRLLLKKPEKKLEITKKPSAMLETTEGVISEETSFIAKDPREALLAQLEKALGNGLVEPKFFCSARAEVKLGKNGKGYKVSFKGKHSLTFQNKKLSGPDIGYIASSLFTKALGRSYREFFSFNQIESIEVLGNNCFTINFSSEEGSTKPQKEKWEGSLMIQIAPNKLFLIGDGVSMAGKNLFTKALDRRAIL